MAGVEFTDLWEDWQANKNEYEDTFEASGITGVAKKVEKSLTKWKDTPLYIGVTGSSGAGKSTFINAIRRLEQDEEGAAETGITETTTTMKAYPHPDNEMLKLIDMPGVGTPKFRKYNYCEAVGFEKIDMFIIITHKRFTENDLWLCQEILKRNKQFIFVRSHVAHDLKNVKKTKKREYEKGGEKMLRDVVEKMRKKTKDELKGELGKDVETDQLTVYLIDSLKLEHPLLDFTSLSKKLIDDFPRNKKKALILTLSNLTPALIDEKENVLKNEIWKRAWKSAAGGVIPVPGVSLSIDIAIILSAAKEYRKQFGLESDALEKLAKSIKISTQELCTSTGLKSVGFELTSASILRLCSEFIAREGVENIIACIPVVGPIFSGTLSLAGTTYSLRKMLGMMANDARKVQRYVQSQLLLKL